MAEPRRHVIRYIPQQPGHFTVKNDLDQSVKCTVKVERIHKGKFAVSSCKFTLQNDAVQDLQFIIREAAQIKVRVKYEDVLRGSIIGNLYIIFIPSVPSVPVA